MKSTTFALTALASLGLVFADGWHNNTEIVPPYSETTHYPENKTETIPPITTYTTRTGYTTYCPESTVLTITVCEDHKCAPHVYTVPESSTLTITEECIFPTAPTPDEVHETTKNPDVTVTGYTTYLPKPTVVTISTCSDDKCAPHEYTISKATTLTVSEAVIPNTIGSAGPKTTLAAVSTYEAGAAKIAASFAGLVGVVLLV